MAKIELDKNQKKSETIEIRISHDTKEALQNKARREGRTLSDIVRQLIVTYLEQPSQRTFLTHQKEKMMSIKSRLTTKIASFAGGVLALVVASVTVMGALFTTASAEDVRLEVQGGSAQQCGQNLETLSDAFKGELAVNFGESASMIIESANDPALSNTAKQYFIKMEIQEIEKNLSISVSLFDGVDENGKNIASPSFVIGYDEEAAMNIGLETGDCYKLKFLARKAGDSKT